MPTCARNWRAAEGSPSVCGRSSGASCCRSCCASRSATAGSVIPRSGCPRGLAACTRAPLSCGSFRSRSSSTGCRASCGTWHSGRGNRSSWSSRARRCGSTEAWSRRLPTRSFIWCVTPSITASSRRRSRARLRLRAAKRGAEIDIEIADDGRGLDAEAIRAKAVARGLVTAARAAELADEEIFQFIFAPGLSTAATVTETSGRGVGMDVVLNTVRRCNGNITLRSVRGRGTAFVLTLPVSAALQSTLIVRINGQSLAIREQHVIAVAEIEREAIRQVGAQRATRYRDATLPLYSLA